MTSGRAALLHLKPLAAATAAFPSSLVKFIRFVPDSVKEKYTARRLPSPLTPSRQARNVMRYTSFN